MDGTLKKNIIIGFSMIPDIQEFQGNSILLATPMGLICGTPAKLPDEGGDSDDRAAINVLYSKILQHIGDQYKGEVGGNDGYLLLDNVSIRSNGNQTINVGTMIVFYDQIIGISFGTLQD